MLQVFKRNNISAYIALLLIAVLCKMKYLLHPDLVRADSMAFDALFFNMNKLKSFFRLQPTLYILLSLLMQFALAVYLNAVVNRQKLYPHKNYFTALSFILITSLLPVFNFFSVAFIANLFVLISFSSVLGLSNTTLPRKACFNIGLLLGLAVFFYFPAILFVLLFILFIWLLRPFLLQELLAYLIGFATPLYFAMAMLYLNGNLKQVLSHLQLHLQLPLKHSQTLPLAVFALIGLIYLVYSLYLSGQSSFKNAMIVKKKWRFITAYLLFGLVAGSFSGIFPQTYFILALTPFSILLSQSFHNRNEKLNIFTLFFLIISALCVQWILLK